MWHYLNILYPYFSLHLCACMTRPYFLIRSSQWSNVCLSPPHPSSSCSYFPLSPSHSFLHILLPFYSISCSPEKAAALCLYILQISFISPLNMHTLCFFPCSLALSLLWLLCGITEIAECLYGAAQTMTHDRT